jgi:hypothetical protein
MKNDAALNSDHEYGRHYDMVVVINYISFLYKKGNKGEKQKR